MKAEPAITTPPNISGPRARAWEVDLVSARARAGICETDDSTVALWLIEAPEACETWHSYVLRMSHRRHSSTNGPSHIVELFAVDPSFDRNQYIINGYGTLLAPANFFATLLIDSDQVAADEAQQAVECVCWGALTPNPDADGPVAEMKWLNFFNGEKL